MNRGKWFADTRMPWRDRFRVALATDARVWGGYHAYVADPTGVCWEVAHNPGWSVAGDGTVRIGGEEQ